MTQANLIEGWTKRQAFVLTLICLMAGIVGGWSIRAARSMSSSGSAQSDSAPPTAGKNVSQESQRQNPERLKGMADAQAASQINELRSNPNNADLLTSIGNIYYDAQQYPDAIDYYRRALKLKPTAAAVRTDMATAEWYLGNADDAIAEFNQALIYAPTNPNTLFNRGLVKWQGKRDAAGAIADWNNLLAANPNYEGKDKVEQMLVEVARNTAAQRH